MILYIIIVRGDRAARRAPPAGGTVWFDKLLHFGNSVLIGLVAFLVVYALRFTGRLRTSAVVDAVVILLLSLGIGALRPARSAPRTWTAKTCAGSPSSALPLPCSTPRATGPVTSSVPGTRRASWTWPRRCATSRGGENPRPSEVRSK